MKQLLFVILLLQVGAAFAQSGAQWTVSGTAYMPDGSPATNDENKAASVFVLTDDQMKQFAKCVDDGIDRFNCATRNKSDSVQAGHDGSFAFRLKDGAYHLVGVGSESDPFSIHQYFGAETISVRGADVHKDISLN